MEGAKTVLVAVLMAAILFSSVSARNITVGGATGWDLSTNFTYWSSSTLVFFNDSLEFINTRAHDVIEVTRANFATCDTTSCPIAAYCDINGKTLINLSKSRPRYFVCGRSNHCIQGLKLYVRVLDRLQPNTSSPSYPSKPPGDHTNPAASPNYEHKMHSPNSSSGEKTEEVPLWLRGALTIISLTTVLFRLARGGLVGFLVRVYYINFFSPLVLVEAILVTYFLVQHHSKAKTSHINCCLFGNLGALPPINGEAENGGVVLPPINGEAENGGALPPPPPINGEANGFANGGENNGGADDGGEDNGGADDGNNGDDGGEDGDEDGAEEEDGDDEEESEEEDDEEESGEEEDEDDEDDSEEEEEDGESDGDNNEEAVVEGEADMDEGEQGDNIVPILEYNDPYIYDDDNDGGEEGQWVGQIDMRICHSWDGLATSIHEVYVEVTQNDREDNVTPTNCWPGMVVQYCDADGFPNFHWANEEEHDAFDLLAEGMKIIKIRPMA